MTEPEPTVVALRSRRAELRDAMDGLELALAAPSVVDPAAWSARVLAAVDEVALGVRAHIEITEGLGGLYEDVLAAAPRLQPTVARLAREHVLLTRQVDALWAALDTPELDVEEARALGTTLLGTLVVHRQRGADLVYEAYEVDIGGDT